MVVHDVGQVVEAGAVGPLDDVVLLAGPLDLDLAADQVVDHQRALAGHLQADDRPAALGLEAGPLGRRLGHEAAAVDERPLLALGRLPLGLEFLGRGVVVVGRPGRQEPLDRRPVALAPLRLVVGGIGAAHLRPLVPVDAQPPQAVQDRGQGLLDVPLLVRVVDAEDELAAVPPGEEPAKQRGPHAADVQVSRRTGGKTRANGHEAGSGGCDRATPAPSEGRLAVYRHHIIPDSARSVYGREKALWALEL